MPSLKVRSIPDVYVLCNDTKKAEEAKHVHDAYVLRLDKDMGKAGNCQEHNLINVWDSSFNSNHITQGIKVCR